MMDFLPPELDFVKDNATWAIVGDSGSGHSELVRRIAGKGVEQVSFKHHFRNLSNTSDFYYQQRFNSSDSEDAQTVHEYLLAQQPVHSAGYWNYGRVTSALKLENLLSEQVIKLSNGETKRLLIATALIRGAKMLVLDHPLTGLDKDTRVTFGLLLDQIIHSGIQVVIATNPHEIPEAVTHVAVMKDGHIIFADAINSYHKQQFSFENYPETDISVLKQLVSFSSMPVYDVIVRMTDVNVRYDGRKILSHVTWLVKQGERWSLSGPNGAGKSTLLSLINADNPQAYANNIVLFDRRRGTGESIWDIKKQTGFVSPELYQYFPTDSSCLHVIESGFYDTVGLFRPTDPVKEEICLKWMNLFHAGKYANRLFSMVPVSVQRLCLLARALVKNPALLILDEPTQGLDEAQQHFFVRLIDEICSLSKVTLIYVTHYEQHIPKSVTKHLRLRNGEVV